MLALYLVQSLRLLQQACDGVEKHGYEDGNVTRFLATDENGYNMSNNSTSNETDYQADEGRDWRSKAFMRMQLARSFEMTGALLGFAVCAYTAHRLYERYRRRSDPTYGMAPAEVLLLQRQNAQRDLDHGAVARKAGLAGLTMDERKLVVERLLEERNETEESSQVRHKEVSMDLEMGTIFALSLVVEADKKSVHEGIDVADKSKAPSNINSDSNSFEGSETERDSSNMCSICLASYEQNDPVFIGAKCSHMFHSTCAKEWMLQHDLCPYCRAEMIHAKQLRQAAKQVLSKIRVKEMTVLAKTIQKQRSRALAAARMSNSDGNGDANGDVSVSNPAAESVEVLNDVEEERADPVTTSPMTT